MFNYMIDCDVNIDGCNPFSAIGYFDDLMIPLNNLLIVSTYDITKDDVDLILKRIKKLLKYELSDLSYDFNLSTMTLTNVKVYRLKDVNEIYNTIEKNPILSYSY